MNNSLNTSTESFVDPHEEIFIGPITDREREIRKNLPRRTLHPSEVEELTQRGMNYKEWEEYKEQCNSEAIKQVYDEEHESSTDSFSSCNSDDEGKSQDGSLNDTWEIQERMLAMAERLERGEDIPELGICHNGGTDESVDMDGIFPLDDTKSPEISNCELNCEISESSDGQKNELVEVVLAGQALSEGAKQVSEAIDEQETLKSSSEDSKKRDSTKSSDVEIVSPLKDLDLIDLNTMNVEEIVQNSTSIEKGNDILLPNSCIVDKFLMKTPTKTPRTGMSTSSNGGKSFKTPIGTHLSSSATKKRTPMTASSLKKPTPSPVGMYIRGGPEPMLIENVRPTQKKLPYTNPAITRQKIAVKNAQGRWSIDVKRSPTDNDFRASKENAPEIDSNIKPVLPVVLHEAVASMVTGNSSSKETSTMPWSRGKIGKLLERNPSPTVLKHQGRIQVNKAEIPQTTKIPHVTLKSGKKLNHRESSLMDVSVLQEVVSSIQLPASQKSGIPLRRAYNFLK